MTSHSQRSPASFDTPAATRESVAYEVVVDVEPALAERFARYMRETHIPQILGTGCFATIRFEQASPTRFRTAYVAHNQADVDRYLAQHTAAFRADFAANFPSGATATRETWTLVERWTR